MIGVEVLSRLIDRAEGNFLFGCKVSGRGEEGLVLTHLLYVDDTLIFCGADRIQLVYLRWLLLWFEALSGLMINLSKSEIIPVGRVDGFEALAAELGCKVGLLPASYLGLWLGAYHNSIVVWDPIEERFRKRLTLWKRQFISKGGRTTLIRSTLSSLLIYFMSLFHLPRIVKIRMERIQRNFLWGGDALEKKPHLVNWSTVCLAKQKGGLGVRGLTNPNRVLLSKWSWRFANERDSLWRFVIGTKLGEDEGGWCTLFLMDLRHWFVERDKKGLGDSPP